MAEKTHTEKANQRIIPLPQNTFRFPLHIHFLCILEWKILMLSFSVPDVVTLYIIFYCVYIGEIERCRYVYAT